MQNLNMPLEQAFNIISQALAQANSNREGHALMQTAENRIKEEIASLSQQLADSKARYEEYRSLNSAPPPSSSDSSPG